VGIAELSALATTDTAVEGEGIQRTHRSTFRRADGAEGQMFKYLFGCQA
jgi:hypothetical protein